MSITADDQKLEPGNQITLFEVDGTAFGADVLYFHNHAVAYTEEEVLAAGDDESKLSVTAGRRALSLIDLPANGIAGWKIVLVPGKAR